MSNDPRAAAERLRRYKAARNQRDTYQGTDHYVVRDWAMLADAYLAEHRADDGEAITELWLRSVGFEANNHELRMRVDDDPDYHVWLETTPPHPESDQDWYFRLEGGEDRMETVWLPEYINTRSAIRRLAAVLGVELKEGS